VRDARMPRQALRNRLEDRGPLHLLGVALEDLFDNAMTLFQWAVEEVMRGNVIASYNRSTEHVEVVRLPVVENAARKPQRKVELVDTKAATSDQVRPRLAAS